MSLNTDYAYMCEKIISLNSIEMINTTTIIQSKKRSTHSGKSLHVTHGWS